MAKTVLVLNGHRSDFPARDSGDVHAQFNEVLQYIKAIQTGVRDGTSLEVLGTGVAATGTITFATGSGEIGAVIGGTAVVVTWADSDTASAAALAVAINANTTVNKWVVATSELGVVTLTALVPGHIGNNVTLAVSGAGSGHTVSGARLTGGSNDTKVTYTL